MSISTHTAISERQLKFKVEIGNYLHKYQIALSKLCAHHTDSNQCMGQQAKSWKTMKSLSWSLVINDKQAPFGFFFQLSRLSCIGFCKQQNIAKLAPKYRYRFLVANNFPSDKKEAYMHNIIVVFFHAVL